MSKIRMNTELRNKLFNKIKNRKAQMMYLIIKEIKLSDTSIFNVVSFTDNLDKANDMLQGYNLIEKDNKNVVYSIIKYEQPLKLTKEMEC